MSSDPTKAPDPTAESSTASTEAEPSTPRDCTPEELAYLQRLANIAVANLFEIARAMRRAEER